MDRVKLSSVVQMYFRTKALILKAEETDPAFKSFLQPKMEFSSALDHLMRVQAAELGMKEGDPEYISKNLDKVLGHLYRAFFDVADWLSINMREKIANDLQPFHYDTLSSVFPEYYQKMKPALDIITRKIIDIRNNKDIANTKIIAEVEEYGGIIEELEKNTGLISERLGALQEYEGKRNAQATGERRYSVRTGFWLALVSAVSGVLLTLLIQALSK